MGLGCQDGANIEQHASKHRPTISETCCMGVVFDVCRFCIRFGTPLRCENRVLTQDRLYSIRQGASHQPGPAPDARSDERASEEADSTRVELSIVNLWGVLGTIWLLLRLWEPHFLSLEEHFWSLWGSFWEPWGVLWGSLGCLGPSFRRLCSLNPPVVNSACSILEA